MEETKRKIVLEYDMKSTPVLLLWNYVSTANGLSEWFADEVVFNHKDCVFSWNGASQQAMMLGARLGVYIKFRWEGDSAGCFFEFRISVNELTDATVLQVTDYAEVGDEQDAIDLWNLQIETLRRRIGC